MGDGLWASVDPSRPVTPTTTAAVAAPLRAM